MVSVKEWNEFKERNIQVVPNPFELTEFEKTFSESTQALMVLAKRSHIQ